MLHLLQYWDKEQWKRKVITLHVYQWQVGWAHCVGVHWALILLSKDLMWTRGDSNSPVDEGITSKEPALLGDLAQLLSDSQLKSYITSTFTIFLWAPLLQVGSILVIQQTFSETCWHRRDPSFHMLQKVKTGNLNGQTFLKRHCLLHVSPLLSTFRKKNNVINDKDKAPPYRPTQILISFLNNEGVTNSLPCFPQEGEVKG